MATIAVRVSDETRDRLLEQAQERGVTLSEMIRELLDETAFPLREVEAAKAEVAPSTLTARDRHMFSMLHRILARVLPEDANEEDGDRAYQLQRARVLDKGFTREYSSSFAGIDPELSPRDSERVMDILDMFRILDFSVKKHEEEGSPIREDVKSDLDYQGFDFNDALEGQMADYVEFLVNSGRWSERQKSIEERDNGNSHAQMLDIYLRMLAEYRRISEERKRGRSWDHFLTQEELLAIADATVHPSNRGRFKRSQD
jgi:uncharacterized protein YfbU (UPF0304 family)